MSSCTGGETSEVMDEDLDEAYKLLRDASEEAGKEAEDEEDVVNYSQHELITVGGPDTQQSGLSRQPR